MTQPTKAEKLEVIKAAKKMGCRIYSNIRWYDNGVRSTLMFRVLREGHIKEFNDEYEAALDFLKQSLIND